MSDMNQIVFFTENNARIIYASEAETIRWKHAGLDFLVNPEIPQGVEPHYWRKSGDHIVTMTEDERRDRDDHIQKNGAINQFPAVKSEFVETVTEIQKTREVLRLAEWIIGSLIIISVLIIGFLKIRHG